MTTPNLAVLMAVHNPKEDELKAAVASLLQNKATFDLILVDDGSTRPIRTEALPLKEDHITLVRLPQNVGLAQALNEGIRVIQKAGYPFVARMDHDDISLPNRLDAQLAFLGEHQDVMLVGTHATFVDGKTGQSLFTFAPPTRHTAIRKEMHINNCFSHPSVMMRSAVFQKVGVYNPRFRLAQDYEFFYRIVEAAKTCNLPTPYVRYTVNRSSLSQKKRFAQLKNRLIVQLWHFTPLSLKAWEGLARTLILMVTPRSLVQTLKTMLKTKKKA